MNANEFLKSVDLLENKEFSKLKERFVQEENIRLLHSGIGLCTEVGEFQDLLKKKVMYGKDIEKSKLVDELGDILWYFGVACNVLGVSMEEVMEKNWKKLSTRYGDKLQFSENAAINKNKEAEWKAQES